MFIVHVFVHVKPDQVEAFKAATMENARNSVQEPGIARFDVIQQQDDPTTNGYGRTPNPAGPKAQPATAGGAAPPGDRA